MKIENHLMKTTKENKYGLLDKKKNKVQKGQLGPSGFGVGDDPLHVGQNEVAAQGPSPSHVAVGNGYR